MPDELYPRFATARVRAAMADTPVVLLNGPRQSGKTTLARMQADDARAYRTLDDETTLAAATADPVGFVRDLGLATIDEVQRAPALLRAIKKSVDDDRRPGRFLLTGSTNILSLPQAADSLAGRMAIIDLLPLAQAEIAKVQPDFLPSILSGTPAAAPAKVPLGNQLVRTVLTGGYPEMVRRHDPARRAEWARNYIRAIMQRDVRDIATVDKLDQMPRLLRVLAQHAGQLANYTAIGNSLDMDAKTVRRYVGVLQQLFLIHSLEPWSTNQLKRLIKTPKLHFIDSGLLASLLGVTPANAGDRRKIFGAILESFVVAEIARLASATGSEFQLSHYRDKDQNEVDLVIENAAGDIVGIEVKAAATVTDGDFIGLRKLAAACKPRFRCGLVLHDDDKVHPFGAAMYAAPLSSLWAGEMGMAI